jgi:hypothetical protein
MSLIKSIIAYMNSVYIFEITNRHNEKESTQERACGEIPRPGAESRAGHFGVSRRPEPASIAA